LRAIGLSLAVALRHVVGIAGRHRAGARYCPYGNIVSTPGRGKPCPYRLSPQVILL